MDLFALFNLPQFQNSISLAHYMESKQNCIKKTFISLLDREESDNGPESVAH